jgi:glycosyltransferase involved in cell wall biosynthesis
MVDVSIVIPCLNEALSLDHCLANAKAALAEIERQWGLEGEIVVADNGSTDGSQDIARRAGARVVPVERRGYGAALIGGFGAAKGRFLVMADADGSYDFLDAVPMIGRLADGADLCMGSRFLGGIKPGAMPWKNRYIGNPILSSILRLLFRTRISDAHCGIRALTKSCFERLRLSGSGMEFASEMVIKAALLKVRIDETPATLHPDLRDRPPHLRPWRDGWRHLRYLLMLSPTWVFAVPALAAIAAGLVILLFAGLRFFGIGDVTTFGTTWTIFAGALLGVGHIAGLLAVASHLYGVRQGYRAPKKLTPRLAGFVNLETMLMSGLASMLAGAALLALVAIYWSARGFSELDNIFPVVAGTALIVLGTQNVLGGFLLSIVGGNEAAFLRDMPIIASSEGEAESSIRKAEAARARAA